ncbi:hypothetical protein I203_100794 [Kwoniella mangroviensis CBS 8507]|uniref:uncharacterized protein n=1 Tax=Kwoniella mangroviensis CBS 8507 TaxID=1296122 RepID=UPI00080CD76E|nr:uncharacterized protein I203_06673 [Kwoniella mangroviensis CBS 8507]OCF64089.1 hypothetical protein I203_06673 [Kwoniella mangroviensis CBS 8507]
MFSRFIYIFAFLASAVFVQAQDDAWHLDYIYVLANEEIDPIVSPNQQSSHMHKIIGGSRMSAFYNSDYYSAASCSSLRQQADKSNYWMPNLYVIDTDTNKFVPVPILARFYYFLSRNSQYQNVSPFPKGLRILTGDPNNKSPTNVVTFTCQINQDFSGSLIGTSFNFNRDCPYGMKTELYFPPCWDGLNLYKSDGSHMSWPDNGVRSGSCPWSHPVRLPAIQLEYTWSTSNYNPGQALAGKLAWANGDTTGYGVHGDFVEGWDQALLNKALNANGTCVGVYHSMQMGECPVLAPTMDDAAAKACKPERGELQESFGNVDNVPIPRLPGCNPLWGATGDKPGCNPAIAGLDVSKMTGTDGPYVASAADNKVFKYPTTPGWHNIACLKEITALTGGVSYTDSSMTVESCQQSCLAAGYQFAGTGQVGAWNCVCGNAIRPSASVYPGMCSTPCPGNSAQQCGGSYIFNIWYAANGTTQNTTTLADGTQYVGCYNNPGTASAGLLGASTYNFQSSSMTTETCIAACHNLNTNWALTTSAKWCYCGNDWNFGTGSLVPSSYCTVACTGNSTEKCGDYYRSSVYNITAASIEKSSVYHPPGWQGCYQDLSGRLALTNNYWSGTITPQSCINGCSELGYSYAGVENGKTCYCGNSPQITQRLPVSQCSTACTGNSTAVCGGTNAMDLYTTASANITAATVKASKPAGYLGCFQDSGSNIAFQNYYSYTVNPMSVEICKQSCMELGYSYAGVENSNQCRCGNNVPTTTQYVSSLQCNKVCSGNSSETCGAGGYLEAYTLDNSTMSAVMPGVSAADYITCYENSNRGLTGYTYYDSGMTIEKCRTTCSEFGYGLASVYLSKYCGCGNSWTGATQKYPSSSCQYYKCGGNSTEYCGGQTQAAVYNTSEVTVTINKPDGWVSCWTDSGSARTLQDYSYTANPLSAKACRVACANQGYQYAGTESGNQCFCGNKVANGAKAPTSACNTQCAGNANETCGASGYMDLYNATGAVANNGIRGYLGCFTDDSTFNGNSYVSDWMSVDSCNQWCYARGSAYAGIRNGNQCKCSSVAPTLVTTSASCNNPCSGNSTQNCGTATTIAAYELANTGIKSADFVVNSNSTGYVGCFREGSTRMLPSYYFSSSSMTNDLCISNCKALGYAYAGSEYASQCYCAAKLDPTSGGYRVAESACNQACAGKVGICGSGNILSVYSTLNATTSTPAVEGLKGCYSQGTFGQAPSLSYSGGYMTASLCRRACRNGGFSIAGTTNGNTCVCGNSATYGAAAAPASCNAPCQGNTTETCGATFSSAWSIYDTTGAGSDTPAGFPANYVGCVNDGSPRVLPNYSITNGGMSSDACRKICVAAGYNNYGTEAGTQCYCGTTKPVTALLPDSQCTSKCPGAPTEACGAGGKMSLYSVAGASSNTTASVSASASASITGSASTSGSVSASKSASASVSSVAASSSSSRAASSVTIASSSSSSKPASSAAASSSSSSVSMAASSSSSSSASKATSSSAAAAASSSTSKPASSNASSSKASMPGGGAIATGGTVSVTSTSTAASAITSAVTKPATSSVTSSSAAPASSSKSVAAASSSSSKAPASSAVTATSTTVIQSSSTTSSNAAIPTGTALGCWTGGNTVFSSAVMTGHDNLTPSMCQIWCNANYYTYSGLSGGNTCGCSNSLDGLTSAASSSCSTKCSGDSNQVCGGTINSTYSVFRAQAATKPSNAKRFDSGSASIRRRNERRIVHSPNKNEGTMKRRGKGVFANW